ncbi:MAG: HEAT repeat domain-containing protein [Rivularia sp. (in: cyanobacteria)]
MQSDKNYQSLISQLSQLSDEQLKRDYLNHLEWTQPIASMLPLIDDVEALRVVRLALDVDLMLSAFLAGKVKSELQEETVGWIRELEIYDELKLKLLTKTKSKVAVSFLEDFIKNIPVPVDSFSLYEYIVSQAIKDLEIVDTELYTKMLLKLLQDERHWVRKISIAVFGRYIDKSEVSVIVELLKDEDIQVRYRAISALGIVADISVLENIIEALDDEFSSVRAGAIGILGRIGGKSILNKIINFIDDKDCSVRSQTIKALRIIGGEVAEELIIHAFLDENDFVSKSVFETLLKIDRNKGIQLIFLASQSDDAEVRRKATLFLGSIVRTPDRVSDLHLLVKLLNDENSQVRKTAAKALTLPKTGMESPEFEALREEYKELRWKAEIDIEEIINEFDLTTLLLKSIDRDYYVRKAANKAIDIKIAKAENIQDTKEDFLTALQHENPNIRGKAAIHLGKIGGKSVIPNLLKALQDEHPKVRSRAIVALTSIADKFIIIPVLLQSLKDENYTVRSLTANLLGDIADNSTAIPSVSFANALIEALQDEDIGVRREAISTLSKIDSERAIEVILVSLPYKDNFIDRIAASILSKAGKLQYIPYLWKALVQAKYINQAKGIHCPSATDNLYSAIEKTQQQHQRYNPNLIN